MAQATVLCSQHAQARLTGDLIFSLLLGWWGVWSFFINLAGVAEQIAEMASLKSLQAASAPAPAAETET